MSARPVIIGLALTALVLASAHIRTGDALQAYAAKPKLSWRQEAIIKTRAKVHACQDELGVHRSPVAQRVVTGGPKYRAWVLYRWRYRLRFCRDVVRDLNANPVKAIMAVWGPKHGPYAVQVAKCESGSYWPDRAHLASNGEYQGMFQMGNWARGRYGHGHTFLAQARAAFANFRDNGWSQWACA